MTAVSDEPSAVSPGLTETLELLEYRIVVCFLNTSKYIEEHDKGFSVCGSKWRVFFAYQTKRIWNETVASSYICWNTWKKKLKKKNTWGSLFRKPYQTQIMFNDIFNETNWIVC